MSHPIRRSIARLPARLKAGGWSRVGMLDAIDAMMYGTGKPACAARGVPSGAHPRLLVDVHVPAGGADDAPVLLWFYGGSWSSGRRQDYGFAARAFASFGFVVVVPDYRLVPHVRFPNFVEDAAAAAAWAVANVARYGGDPARVAVAGHSAGAYIAAMLALDARWLRAVGVGRISAAVGLAGPYDFHPFTTASTHAAFGAAPDPLATQPITFVRRDAPPMLLATGDADLTVRPRNSIRLAEALHAAGAPATLRRYPDLTHAGILQVLSKPFRNLAPVLGDAVAFLRQAMGRS